MGIIIIWAVARYYQTYQNKIREEKGKNFEKEKKRPWKEKVVFGKSPKKKKKVRDWFKLKNNSLRYLKTKFFFQRFDTCFSPYFKHLV